MCVGSPSPRRVRACRGGGRASRGCMLRPEPVGRFRPASPALAVAALAAAAAPPVRAQAPAQKLDPLLRPLLDAAVVARIDRTSRIEALGAVLQRPLPEAVVLRRDPGGVETFVDVFVSLDQRSPAAIEALGG